MTHICPNYTIWFCWPVWGLHFCRGAGNGVSQNFSKAMVKSVTYFCYLLILKKHLLVRTYLVVLYPFAANYFLPAWTSLVTFPLSCSWTKAKYCGRLSLGNLPSQIESSPTIRISNSDDDFDTNLISSQRSSRLSWYQLKFDLCSIKVYFEQFLIKRLKKMTLKSFKRLKKSINWSKKST